MVSNLCESSKSGVHRAPVHAATNGETRSTWLSRKVRRTGELTKTAGKMRCKEGTLCVTSKSKCQGQRDTGVAACGSQGRPGSEEEVVNYVKR